jgi:hypothetical protein
MSESESDESESNQRQNQLLCENTKEVKNDITFISKLVKTKSERICYSINKGKSDVWKAFKRVVFEGEDTLFVKCVKCNKLLKYNSYTGNSHLKKHSKKCEESVKSQTISDMFKDYSKFKTKISDSAAICCSVDLLPFSFIKGKGFKILANELVKIGKQSNQFIDIDKLLPTGKTVSNHVLLIYEKIKTKLIPNLENIKYFGLTTDHWVNDITKNNYLTLTIQYLINNSLKARVLCTKEVEDKTALITKFRVNEVLSDFGIKYKSYAMVTDNARAMKSAFCDIPWIGCSSHNMILVQKHAFDECKSIDSINKLIENSKLLVKWAKQSGSQQQLNTSLKQFIEVRWDSKYDMLYSIQCNYKSLLMICNENKKVYEWL